MIDLLQLAFQVMFLFEKYKIGLGLPTSEKAFFSEHYNHARAILKELQGKAVSEELIPNAMTLQEFAAMFHSTFIYVREQRIDALKTSNYAPNFKFPYNTELFLIQQPIIITDSIFEKEILSSKLSEFSPEPEIQHSGIIPADTEHDIPMYGDTDMDEEAA